MAADQSIQIPRVKLGNQGFEVSKLGFGCMGLTGVYNDPVPEDVGISIIKHAFDHGVTFFDTSDIYGANNANEILVGKALKQLPREKVQLATKFGVVKFDFSSGAVINGTPEYVRSCCEASLKRLDVEYIDLYYQHRIDTSVPIEDTMGELKKLVEEGKIKYIGLSEASPDTIRRANAVHPIAAIQMEWSLWTRDIEEEIVPLCRELGIGIVPYSPLGSGFFGGRAVVESIPATSSLPSLPRFSGENFDKNKKLYWNVEKLAEKHDCSPAQLALSWILHQGDDVVPIPGIRSAAWRRKAADRRRKEGRKEIDGGRKEGDRSAEGRRSTARKEGDRRRKEGRRSTARKEGDRPAEGRKEIDGEEGRRSTAEGRKEIDRRKEGRRSTARKEGDRRRKEGRRLVE